jgi:hypothetical protein
LHARLALFSPLSISRLKARISRSGASGHLCLSYRHRIHDLSRASRVTYLKDTLATSALAKSALPYVIPAL